MEGNNALLMGVHSLGVSLPSSSSIIYKYLVKSHIASGKPPKDLTGDQYRVFLDSFETLLLVHLCRGSVNEALGMASFYSSWTECFIQKTCPNEHGRSQLPPKSPTPGPNDHPDKQVRTGAAHFHLPPSSSTPHHSRPPSQNDDRNSNNHHPASSGNPHRRHPQKLQTLPSGDVEDPAEDTDVAKEAATTQLSDPSVTMSHEQCLVLQARAHALNALALLACSTSEKEDERSEHEFKLANYIMDDELGAMFPDTTTLFAIGMSHLNRGRINEASEYFAVSARSTRVFKHRVKQMFNYICLAWSYFLSGRRHLAQKILDSILRFASMSSHLQLHIWALELDMFMKAFIRDYSGVEEARTVISSMQHNARSRSDMLTNHQNSPNTFAASSTHNTNAANASHHNNSNEGGNGSLPTSRRQSLPSEIPVLINATSSALYAFSLVVSHRYEEASVYAVYATNKLMARKQQGTAFGCVIFFVAIYSLLEVIEYRTAIEKNKSSDGLKGQLQPVLDATGTKTRRFSFLWRHSKSLDTKQMLTIACAARDVLNLQATHFKIIGPLVWILSCKTRSIEAAEYSLLLLELYGELDVAIDFYEDVLKEFVFADAFVHTERAMLSSALHASYEYRPGSKKDAIASDSRDVARLCFNRLGSFLPERLEAICNPRYSNVPYTEVLDRSLHGNLDLNKDSNMSERNDEDLVSCIDDDRE